MFSSGSLFCKFQLDFDEKKIEKKYSILYKTEDDSTKTIYSQKEKVLGESMTTEIYENRNIEIENIGGKTYHLNHCSY